MGIPFPLYEQRGKFHKPKDDGAIEIMANTQVLKDVASVNKTSMQVTPIATIAGITYVAPWEAEVASYLAGDYYLDFTRYLYDPYPNGGEYVKLQLTFANETNLPVGEWSFAYLVVHFGNDDEPTRNDYSWQINLTENEARRLLIQESFACGVKS